MTIIVTLDELVHLGRIGTDSIETLDVFQSAVNYIDLVVSELVYEPNTLDIQINDPTNTYRVLRNPEDEAQPFTVVCE